MNLLQKIKCFFTGCKDKKIATAAPTPSVFVTPDPVVVDEQSLDQLKPVSKPKKKKIELKEKPKAVKKKSVSTAAVSTEKKGTKAKKEAPKK